MTIFSFIGTRRFASHVERAASGIIAVWAVFAPGMAQAKTSAWINTSIKADYASNPFLVSGPKTSAASATISVSPGLKYTDGQKTINFSADYRHSEFSRRFSSNESYSTNASLSQKMSSRLDFNANIGVDSSIVGANDLLTFGPNPVNGGAFPPLPGDIALNGLRQRRQAINGGIGLNYIASARDSIQTQGGFSMVRFPSGSVASEYDSANGSIGYDRVLNSRTSVGLNLSVSRADYRQTSLGDATTFSPQATFSTKFGANWSLTAALGVSYSKIRGLNGRSTQTSASGRLNLCNASSRGKLCLFGSRSIQPTSFGNSVRPQTSAGVSYNLRLDTRSTIDATANLTRSGQIGISNIVTSRSVDYAQASLTYSRRISQRLNGFVTGIYADSYHDPIQRRANANLSVGISYAFGDIR